MKSITPVISVILLILITIVASAAAYFFVQNMGDTLFGQAGNQAQETSAYCSRIRLLSMDSDKITVQNNGCGEISSVVVMINGVPTIFNLAYPLGEGEIGEIPVSNLDIGVYDVKVLLDNGLFQEITYRAITESSNYTFTYPISYFAGQNSLWVDTNEPNITYIRLPSNANISSLSLTINTPKIFTENSLNFQLDTGSIMGMGGEEGGDELFLLYDINDSDNFIEINISVFELMDYNANMGETYNILNVSINPDYDDTSITYRNGFIHGIIQTSEFELLYFNYSTITHALLNSSIIIGSYYITSFEVDNDNNKYLFYVNSTGDIPYLFVSTNKNGGFYDLSINSSVLSTPIIMDHNPRTVYFDNNTEIFHMVASRKYNTSGSDQDSYKDIVYTKSTDGLTWSAPETILGMYDKEENSVPYSAFYIRPNSAGDLLFIHGEFILGGMDSYLYKKPATGSWQRIKVINECTNSLFVQNVIIDSSNVKFFCLPIEGLLIFKEHNLYYESNDFGGSWSGPNKGYYALTEGEIPVTYFGKINSEGKVAGLSLDLDFDSALISGMAVFPGGFGYRVEENPNVSLKVGNSFVLSGYSLSSRSYSVNIKDYVQAYLAGCSHSCDVPIYIESNASMNVSLSVAGSYALDDFQMYSLESGIASKEYFNPETSNNLYFKVIKNQSITGASVMLNFISPRIINKNVGGETSIRLDGISIDGDKNLFVSLNIIEHDLNEDDQGFFDINISKSTDIGETWTSQENVLNNCYFGMLGYAPTDVNNGYVHGFCNSTLYFNYSLSSHALMTQNLSNVFSQAVHTGELSNDLFILYVNLSNDDLYFAKNNNYAAAVKINDSLDFVYSDAYGANMPTGLIVENEAGIHVIIAGIDYGGGTLTFYYLNSSNGGASWKTQEAFSFPLQSIFPLSFLADGNDIFVYWNIISGVDKYYKYIRYIDGIWGDIATISGGANFVASNNGSTIYAGLNIPQQIYPRDTYGFLTKSEDFGQTWTTPVHAFDYYGVPAMAAAPKFFFDMPYVYGFYQNLNPYPFGDDINDIVKFTELKSVNPTLSIMGSTVWQETGTPSGIVNISGFASSINAYSASCTSQSCTVPFIYSSLTNNNFELSYFGLTTNSTKCSETNACNDNNACTYNNCINNSCQFIPMPEGSITGCTLTTGCFNEFQGGYGVNCRCVGGRCRDSCGDNACQAWESSTSCAEDCLGFFPGQILQFDSINTMSGEGAVYGMCVADFTGDDESEIVVVEKLNTSYNLVIYNYTDGNIVFERQQEITHSGEVLPATVKCGNLSSPAGLKVVVAGSMHNEDLVFIDVINITSGAISVENSTEFHITTFGGDPLLYNYIYSLSIGDIDGAGGNEIFFFAHGYREGTYYDLIHKYNYTDSNMIFDDKISGGQGIFLSEMIVSDLNDSTPLNDLITPNMNNNYLAIYSYNGGLQLDSNNYLTSYGGWSSMKVEDLNNDLKDELVVLFISSANPQKATIRIYSIDSGALMVLDEEELFIDSKDTVPVSISIGEFDSTPGKEIALMLMNGYCPGELGAYFRIYNFTSGSLNFKNQRRVNEVNGLNFANLASYLLTDLHSYDLNNDGSSELIMNGFLTNNPCSFYTTYYNSLVLFEYRE